MGLNGLNTGLEPGGLRSLSQITGVPDAVVDDFEDDDLAEYTGDTGNFTITTSDAVEGSYALAVDTSSGTDIIRSASGLDYYPTKGDRFSFLVRDEGDNTLPEIGFAANANYDGYVIGLYPSKNEVRIRKLSGGSASDLASSSATLSLATWYGVEVQWHDGSGSQPDNTIEATVYEVDTTADLSAELGHGKTKATVSAQDSEYASNSDILIKKGSSSAPSSKTTIFDRYWYLGGVE